MEAIRHSANPTMNTLTFVLSLASLVLAAYHRRIGSTGHRYPIPAVRILTLGANSKTTVVLLSPISRTITYGNRNTGQTATIAAGAGVILASTTNVLTVLTNVGSTWLLVITNCTLGAEAVTMFRTN